ncbi:hypothetical protein GCM10027445_18450 [Amycolatopsis endophytica]|uniref:Putative NADH-flavin reductase n=1 Tax=Amycolatopsis endophytica TaxID=860233 RepID=A0A853B5C8_9PSEU|nr:hypothetical protein [Amycolatopsis endophytica]NYI89941.1 putative NADH-flavin reductase [Amycolatopsis endophytica]
MDTPGFPPESRPFCVAHQAGLDVLRASRADWLYVSPAGDFDHNGDRSGHYRVAAHLHPEDRISYADFAIPLIDEAVDGRHPHEHLLISSS